MFKRHCTITLPTDIVIQELVSRTQHFCDTHGLIQTLSIQTAAKVVVNAIYDVLYTHAPFVNEHNTAEDYLREILPWYSQYAASYYPDVFDAVFHSTEKLLLDIVDIAQYDVWDVRVLRHLTTHIAYLGDYRILEWERQQTGRMGSGDVYVGSEEYPRIRGSLVSMGYYRCLATNLPLRNVNRITSDIIDYYGNIVITTHDISKGLKVV